MKTFILLLLCVWLPFTGFSQKQYNNWAFGDNTLLSFNSGQPVVTNNSFFYAFEGTSCISDTAGNLLFYTDGITVYTADNSTMPNGSGLMGGASSTQAALVVPRPGHSSQYYIFTCDAMENAYARGYRYSIVDMTLNNGKGDVTATKNVLMYAPCTEKLAAVVNATGTGYWIATHQFGNNNLACYELTDTGLSAPVISAGGRNLTTGYDGMGYMQFSNDFKKLAMTVYQYHFGNLSDYSGNELDVFDFDNATGKLTYRYNLMHPPTFVCTYGVTFSPDNSKLYVNGGGPNQLLQFDLSAGGGDSASVIASRKVINPSLASAGAMLLGPDNRLYIAQQAQPYLSVIEKPNLADTACMFVQVGVDLLNGTSQLGLPNFPVGMLGVANNCAVAQVKLEVPKATFCAGDSLPVCTSNTFTSYLWSDHSTGSCIQAKQAGAYFVTVKDANNCPGTSDTITISVNAEPQPVVMADKTIFCADDSVPVCTTNPFVHYSWNVGGNTSCVQAKQAGDYYVTVTDANGCTAQSSHVSMNVYPVSSVSIIEKGDTLSSYGSTHYQWYRNNVAINGATSAVYIATQTGDYSLQITDSNTCTVQSQPTTITVTGFNELTENIIEVYPNPNVTGSWQLVVSNEWIGSKLAVYDDEGSLVFHSEISNQKSAIDLPLARGVYYLQISGNNTNVVKKLVRL